MNNDASHDNFVQSVLKHHNIVDIVGKYVSLSKQGKNYIGLCPFHSEKSPSFHVSHDLQIFKCFGCQIGGDAIKFLMEIEGYSFRETMTLLAEEAGIAVHLQNESQSPEQKQKIKSLDANEQAAKFFEAVLHQTDQGKSALQYVSVERGFTAKAIREFRLGYAPTMRSSLSEYLQKREFNLNELTTLGLIKMVNNQPLDAFRDRLMFPICNASGKVVAFAGRLLNHGNGPKYINTIETNLFNKSKTLYNLHLARSEARKKQQFVLFEGYFDVIRAWEAGVLNGVAAMGTSLTEYHISLMKRYAKEVILCYDGDQAGVNAAMKSMTMLEKQQLAVKVAILPEAQDPDDFIVSHGHSTFTNEILSNALPSTDFKLHMLKKQSNLTHRDGKLKYIRSSLQIIANLTTPTQREVYLKQLSQEQDIQFETLKHEMYEIRKQLEKNKPVGDNIQKPWNNVTNERNIGKPSTMLTSYQVAEKKLLQLMMQSKEITSYVQEHLGSLFYVEVHAAIAAHLYAYFADNETMEANKFLSSLQERQLENAASSLLMESEGVTSSTAVIHDYINVIKKYPQQQQLEQKKQELMKADKAGDLEKAAQIGIEIITLSKQLKQNVTE
ncbi:DNA primase [Longirhabdus pacifica]|uniref:DNA primase n=1 Tax=Longirhabdus pacifica TaxID=2305227 RepID=UPI0010088446|nr:DNA primase [Longirhabdus pacifica]